MGAGTIFAVARKHDGISRVLPHSLEFNSTRDNIQ